MRGGALISLLVLLLASPRAHAVPSAGTEAAEQFHRGIREYQLQHYAEAIQLLEIGFRLSGDPDFLYPLAQSQRLNGECSKAIVSYQRFLQSSPPDYRAQAARENITRCEKLIAEQSVASKALSDAPPPSATSAPPSASLHRPWYRDWLAPTLLASGAAAVVAGASLFAVGHEQAVGANGATSDQVFDSRSRGASSAYSFQIAGLTLLGVAGALVLGSTVRWIYCAKRHRGKGPAPTADASTAAIAF